MGVSWVSDGVSINSGGIYAYRMCLLLMQHRVIDNSYLLRKKWSDSVWTGLLQLSNKLQVFSSGRGNSLDLIFLLLLLSTYTKVLWLLEVKFSMGV